MAADMNLSGLGFKRETVCAVSASFETVLTDLLRMRVVIA
jgi:hypothetical protein